MPTSIDINVRPIAVLADPQNARRAGIYRVEFYDGYSDTSPAEAAAMAVAQVKADWPVAVRHLFSVDAFDANGIIVAPDPDHISPEIPAYGLWDKLSNAPRYDLIAARAQPAGERPRRDGQYDHYTLEVKEGPGLPFAVYGWGTWPRSSVLAGQPMKQFLDSYETREQALAIYPDATPGSKWTNPQNSFDHLPGENDPEPGGMYPDDWR